MNDWTGSVPAFSPDRPIAAIDVPIDGRHEVSVEVAAWLASTWAVPIRLFHVAPPGSEPGFDSRGEAVAASERWPELTITGETVDGEDVAEAIVAAAPATSLLVVSTDNANAWAFKNSVAERLVHRASGPLVLVGPQARLPEPPGDVVVGFDGRPASVAALEAAVAITPTLGRDLWLVQVVPGAAGEGSELRRRAEADLVSRAEGLGPAVSARCEVIESNDPVSAIEAFAGKVGASLIVTGARRRDDASRTTMSSITMGLVANAGRPVLVVGH